MARCCAGRLSPPPLDADANGDASATPSRTRARTERTRRSRVNGQPSPGNAFVNGRPQRSQLCAGGRRRTMGSHSSTCGAVGQGALERVPPPSGRATSDAIARAGTASFPSLPSPSPPRSRRRALADQVALEFGHGAQRVKDETPLTSWRRSGRPPSESAHPRPAAFLRPAASGPTRRTARPDSVHRSNESSNVTPYVSHTSDDDAVASVHLAERDSRPRGRRGQPADVVRPPAPRPAPTSWQMVGTP